VLQLDVQNSESPVRKKARMNSLMHSQKRGTRIHDAFPEVL